MHEHEWRGFKISLEEVDDGFNVRIKGDKEKLRTKLEAMEAYMVFQEKARAAGWPVGHGPMGMFHPMKGMPWMHKMHGMHGMHGHGHDHVHDHDFGKMKEMMQHFYNTVMGKEHDKKEDI